MAFSLDRVLKALLFGASGPLGIKEIQKVFTKYHEQLEPAEIEEPEESDEPEQPFLEAEGMPTSDVPSLVTVTQIRESVDRIAAALEEQDDVFRLVERHNGFMFVSSPRDGEWIRLLRDEPRPMKLSQSALETLAVIAYRQPVVRAEIEKIRGVSVDGALSKLLEREFIRIVGRADLPGRPIQYGSTEEFLEFVGVRSVEELPASDVLSPRQIDQWLHEVTNQKDVTEKEMGLPEGEVADAESTETAEVAETESTESTDVESTETADPESTETESAEVASEAEAISDVESVDDAEELPREEAS